MHRDRCNRRPGCLRVRADIRPKWGAIAVACFLRQISVFALLVWVAGCGVSKEDVKQVSDAVAKHLAGVDMKQFRGLYRLEKLRYVNLQNSISVRKHAISVHIIQNDGKQRPSDPGSVSKHRALPHPEDFYIRHFCPAKSVTDQNDSFMIRLAIYSTRFDENYNVSCPF